MLKNKKQRYVLKITLFIFSNSIIFAPGDIFSFCYTIITYIFTQNKILVWTKIFVGQNISSDLFFVGLNFSSDIIFVTSKKFRHFCPTFFCPIRQPYSKAVTYFLFEVTLVFQTRDIWENVIVPECTIFSWENVKELKVKNK